MDSNPAILDVGDLVQCLYQDGAARGRWFRGRVAFLSEDSKYCDVAYDDGDYECGVPVGENKICLVQDGRMFQHWLDGLKVFIPVGPSKRKTEMTIKILLDEDGKIGLVHSDGRMVERRYYKDVVRELFGAFKGQAQTILKWPTRILPDPKETTREVAPIEKTVVNKRRKKAPIKKNAVSGECCQAEDFEVDPWLVEPLVEDEQEPEKEEDNPVAMKEMTNSLRNSCWKILNSAEGSYGAELLFKITEFHNKMPNDELCQDLIQLLWKGPTHAKGRVHFPDCVRMELANKYLLLLRSKQGMGTKLAKALPQGFWTECLDTIMQPASVYCVEDDESRTTSAALTRVGQTLNVKNSGANLFCYLLQHQLRGYSQLKNDSVSKQQLAGFKSLLKSRALPSNILSSKDGISNGLKRAVRAAFSVLIHYGHYLSNDFCFPDPPAKNDADGSLTPPHATVADRSFVATEVRKLVETMGRIVSYMSWLWAVEEEQSIYDAKYLISGTVINQLEDSKFYPSVFLTGVSPKEKEKQMNRHWADMKLQFALSLDKRISGLLGQKVADEFRVVTKYF